MTKRLTLEDLVGDTRAAAREPGVADAEPGEDPEPDTGTEEPHGSDPVEFFTPWSRQPRSGDRRSRPNPVPVVGGRRHDDPLKVDPFRAE